MPKCPYCRSEVKPDPKNPGKYLCYTCKKRFPENVLLPDDDQPAGDDAQQQVAQPSPQPHIQMNAQPQQQQQQWQAPQPQQDFGGQQQWQQPQQQQWQQPQADAQQWQQPQQQQWQGGAQQFPQQQGMGFGGVQAGMQNIQNAASAQIAANGGTGGLFSYLFVMPDQMKLQQIAASYGDQLLWYKALTYALLFIGAAGSCLGALGSLSTMFSSYGFVAGLVSLLINLLFIPLCLIVRKRMALFTKGSWAELIAISIVSGVLSIISSIVTMISYSSVYSYLGVSGFNVFGLILTVVIVALFVVLNWIYFSKREAYFDYDNAAAGCKPSGVAQMLTGILGGIAGGSANTMGAQPSFQQQPQQWQAPQQGGFDQSQQYQQPQQWQAPQQGGYDPNQQYQQQQPQQWGNPNQWNG